MKPHLVTTKAAQFQTQTKSPVALLDDLTGGTPVHVQGGTVKHQSAENRIPLSLRTMQGAQKLRGNTAQAGRAHGQAQMTGETS